MKKRNIAGLTFTVLLTTMVLFSCGRGRKCRKEKEGSTIEIKQGSENQALEDSIKREKNKLKKELSDY